MSEDILRRDAGKCGSCAAAFVAVAAVEAARAKGQSLTRARAQGQIAVAKTMAEQEPPLLDFAGLCGQSSGAIDLLTRLVQETASEAEDGVGLVAAAADVEAQADDGNLAQVRLVEPILRNRFPRHWRTFMGYVEQEGLPARRQLQMPAGGAQIEQDGQHSPLTIRTEENAVAPAASASRREQALDGPDADRSDHAAAASKTRSGRVVKSRRLDSDDGTTEGTRRGQGAKKRAKEGGGKSRKR